MMMKGRDGAKDSHLVYSSELGRICPNCEKPERDCVCRTESGAVTGDGVVRIRRETKGRGGKTATVVLGVPGDDQFLKELAGSLKRCCGTGGTSKDGIIVIQGDHCDLLMGELARRGFRVRRAGG